jgi:hypothetical protein
MKNKGKRRKYACSNEMKTYATYRKPARIENTI